jgi:hypothetical protein
VLESLKMFESAGRGADSGFEESSATNSQRGSDRAPGLSIVGALSDEAFGACDGAAGAAAAEADQRGASETPSSGVAADPIHHGWHPVSEHRSAAQMTAARAPAAE